jgi:S1-C subfamily serine protease
MSLPRLLTVLLCLSVVIATAESAVCPVCGEVASPDDLYCVACGARLAGAEETLRAKGAVVAVRVDTDLFWRVPDIKPGLTEVAPPRYAGSGFVVDEAGHVVTGAEFLAGWRMVWVRTADGEERPAEVVGIDGPTGIALLKMDDPPPPVVWAESGEPAANAELHVLGLSPELGLLDVPALAAGRRVRSGFNEIECSILLAASVEPALWGGPAIDADGRVTAMVEARPGRFSDSRRALGVPVEILREVTERLASGGVMARPYLGLSPVENAGGPGLLVRYVLPGSPAASTGLTGGDVIVALDGEEATDPVAFQGAVLEREIGETVELALLREDEELTVRVTLAERPPDPHLDAYDALHFHLGLKTEPVPGGFEVTGLVLGGAADRLSYPLEMPKIYRVLAGADFAVERDAELSVPGALEEAVARSYLERHFAVGLFWGPTRFEGKIFIVPLLRPLVA